LCCHPVALHSIAFLILSFSGTCQKRIAMARSAQIGIVAIAALLCHAATLARAFGVASDASAAAENPEIPPHIVCHTEGCAEVQAKLAIIQEKTKIAKGKLDDCAATRKKMEAAFVAAAEKRKEAEIAVAKCVAERTKLAAELRQCAEVDRPAAERGLAKCARERAALEAELKQCAQVDRPKAEKALAQCAKDRAALEAKLATIVEMLKNGGGPNPGPKPVTLPAGRRRRRRGLRKAALTQANTKVALVEQQAVDSAEAGDMGEDAAAEEFSEEDAEVERIQAEIAKLHDQMGELQNLLTELMNKEVTAQQALDGLAKNEDFFSQNLNAANKRELEVLASDKNNEAKYEQVLSLINKMIEDEKVAQGKVDAAATDEGDAAALLQQAQFSEKDARGALLALIQKGQTLRHQALLEDAKAQRETFNKRTAQASALFQAAGRDEAKCDELRAKLVTAQGKLEETETALKSCLDAKKVINEKIEQIQAARAKAEKGLDACLRAKKSLRAKIALCHEKRDAAREKLAACLERKKELKSLIEECHTRRDDARAKLATCLAQKKALKAKIAAATAKLKPQPRMMFVSLEAREGVEAELKSLREQERAAYATFEELLKEVQKQGASLKAAEDALKQSGADEDAILTSLTSIGRQIDEIMKEISEVDEQERLEATMAEDEETNLSDVMNSLTLMRRRQEVAMETAKESDKITRDLTASMMQFSKM